MNATIQIKVDEKLKTKADLLFKDLGTDLTTAVRMFLIQAVAHNGFPFEIKKARELPVRPMSEEEFLANLAISREQAQKGDTMEADAFIEAMRKKYGL